MFKRFQLLAGIVLCLIMFSPLVFSQADKNNQRPNQPSGSEETAQVQASTGQEVEVNEDIYRQFMELKDARQRRMILPEDAFKPGSGSQKLDTLPEESQKHLRNQLREIILQGDEWQPGDEKTSYPYVASQPAVGNPELQKQEAEAWGELLDGYHKREAQIYENSARTNAAMASQNGSAGSNPHDSGSNSGGQAQAADQSNPQPRRQPADSSQNEVPNTTKITSSSSSAGVSQNAMEFLQRMQKQPAQKNTAAAPDHSPEALASSEAESGPGGPETRPNEVTEASDLRQVSGNDREAGNNSDYTDGQNMAGVSQNALEFLQQSGQEGDIEANITAASNSNGSGNNEQLSDTGDQSDSEQDIETSANTGESETFANATETGERPGTTQNALEYVIGQQPAKNEIERPEPTAPGTTSGTLSINDLINAQGVSSGRNASPPPVRKEKTPPADDPPEKDGG